MCCVIAQQVLPVTAKPLHPMLIQPGPRDCTKIAFAWLGNNLRSTERGGGKEIDACCSSSMLSPSLLNALTPPHPARSPPLDTLSHAILR